MVTDVWFCTPPVLPLITADVKSKHSHQSNPSQSAAVYGPRAASAHPFAPPRAHAVAARAHASLCRPSRVCGGSAGAGQRCVTPFRTRAESGPAHPQPCIGPQHCARAQRPADPPRHPPPGPQPSPLGGWVAKPVARWAHRSSVSKTTDRLISGRDPAGIRRIASLT